MPEPLIVIPGDTDQNRGYRITKWHGHNNYECIYCQFSTLWLDGEKGMTAHQLSGNHPWAYPVPEDQRKKEELTTTDPEY